LFLSSGKYDQGCSSWIRDPDPDPDFLLSPDPGCQKGNGSRIRIRNTAVRLSIVLILLAGDFIECCTYFLAQLIVPCQLSGLKIFAFRDPSQTNVLLKKNSEQLSQQDR
jgi:hypothetical protein